MKTVSRIDPIPRKQKKLRVAAYCRVSTDMDAQLESLEAQKSYYENYIGSRADWVLVGIYYDEGITGTKKDKRPDLLRMMEDCEAGKIDFVLTKSVSRFSRNTADCLELVRRLMELHIPIYFEKENLNTSEMEGEFLLSTLSSLAESESVSISENSKWSIQNRFQDGTYKLCSAPYGYRWDGRNLVVDPVQAKVVKRIFAEVLAGKGAGTIAADLNDDGIPAQRCDHWTSTSILGMLTNERYVGDALLQKTFTDEQFNRHRNTGEMDMYCVQEHHEAIISREDFDAVAVLLEQRAAEKNIQKGVNKYQNRYTFSGIIRCAECGSTFKRRVNSGKCGKYAAWCCGTHIADKTKCSIQSVRDEDIKLAFTTMLNKLIYGNSLILKPYLKALKNTLQDESQLRIQYLQGLVAQNTEQRETLTRLMAQGYIDQVLYSRENNGLLAQCEEFRSEIETLKKSRTTRAVQTAETEKLLKFVEKAEMLEEWNEDFFQQFVDYITVYSRNEIGFVLKCGLTLRERI